MFKSSEIVGRRKAVQVVLAALVFLFPGLTWQKNALAQDAGSPDGGEAQDCPEDFVQNNQAADLGVCGSDTGGAGDHEDFSDDGEFGSSEGAGPCDADWSDPRYFAMIEQGEWDRMHENSILDSDLISAGISSTAISYDDKLDQQFVTVHDPIDLRNADKRHSQLDYRPSGAAPLVVARVYHSNQTVFSAKVLVPMGNGWRSHYDRSVQTVNASQLVLHRPNGQAMAFNLSGSDWISNFPSGVLTSTGSGWQYINNRNVTEIYDSNGRLTSLISKGLTISLTYNAKQQLSTVKNSFGKTLSYTYDTAGRVSSIKLPDANSIVYGYSASGNLVSTKFGDGSTRQYVYENTNFPVALTGVIDEAGRRRLTWGYDNTGRPNLGHDGPASSPQAKVQIAWSGNQATVTDARGAQRSRTFGVVNGRTVLTSIQTSSTVDSPATAWSFNYDANGNLQNATTRTGEVRQFAADARGRTATVTRAAGTSSALTAQRTWHPQYRIPTQITVAGVTRNIGVDASGRLTSVSQTAAGSSQQLASVTYNAQGLVKTVTDARGATYTFAYDTAGNRTSITDAAGNIASFTNFTASGRPGRITTASGLVTDLTYDARGRVLTRTVAGATTTYAYDAAGLRTSVSRPDGSSQTFVYDNAGKLASVSNHRGESTSVVRDATGAVVSSASYSATGAVVRQSSVQFDAVSRLAASIDGRGNRSTISYASDGRPAAVSDPLSNTRNFGFDVLSRLTTVASKTTSGTKMQKPSAPDSSVWVNTFDTTKTTLTGATDLNAVSTGYSYDPFNRRIGEASADSGAVGGTRNAAGDLVTFTDARGVSYARTVDLLGRPTSITPQGGTAITVNYVPGRADLLPAKIVDAAGTTIWTYDSAGRLLTKQQTIGGTSRAITISRDSLGRPLTMTYPSGMQVGYTYTADLLTRLTINGAPLMSNITYRPGSQRPASWTWSNGARYSRSFDLDGHVTSVSLGPVSRSYSYDAAGRMTGHADASPQGSASASYSYDEASQLASYNNTGLAAANLPVVNQTYAYDTNGNRLTDSFNGFTYNYAYYGNSNRIATGAWGQTYTYNADGSPAAIGAIALTYDSYGRQSSVTVPQTYRLLLAYNGLGQRVSKISQTWVAPSGGGNALGAGSGSTSSGNDTNAALGWKTTNTVQFVYDHAGHLIGEYDSTANTSQETVWLGDLPVATVRAGVVYLIHADHLGTPRSITRASDNTEVWRWDSDPFGTTLPRNPNGTFTFNLRFPGQYFDAETNWHYNGMRDYDPRIGRYLQADPIGLAGGKNRYGYVDGSPIDRSDQLGLATYMCTRRLNNFPLRFGPLFHQYICTGNSKDGYRCNGLGPTGNMFDSPGRIESDNYREDQCDQVADDNVCMEDCITRRFTEPAPRYSVDLSHGENCQTYANSIAAECRANCKVK